MSRVDADTPVIRTQQGVGSTTWTRPPPYGELTVPELFAFHAEHSPHHPVLAFDEEDGTTRSLTYKDVFYGIRNAARLVSSYIQPPTSHTERPPSTVVGILAVADSATYFTFIVGIMYLGYAPFPISARNSGAAVAHLVRTTHVRELVVSPDAAMQRLAQEAQEELAKEGFRVQLLPLPEFDELYGQNKDPAGVMMGPVNGDQIGLIMHSSGSTAFPKPISISHRNFARWGYWPSFSGDFDLCGLRMSAHGLPLFHVMGTFFIGWTVACGVVMTVFRPSSPPIVSTPEKVIEALVNSKCDSVLCVPSIIEAWSRIPENIPTLQRLKFIMFAGAPLNKHVGDSLRSRDVKIVTAYGLTETGVVAELFPNPDNMPPLEWEYFALNPHVNHVRVYQADQPGIFELIILDSPTISPNTYNSVVDGRRAYATSDLMQEHPTNPEYFKVFGRADDQIILSTGEKTNPVPMETILLQDPHVMAAIIFGRGRLQNGVVIQPKEPFDPADVTKLEEFRNKIWPSIERANKFAPSHSRIFKEMITVTKPSKPFQYTAKGTPRRHVCLRDYAEEIDEIYKKVEESSQVDVSPPSSWTEESIGAYVRGVVMRVMKASNIKDEDDLFQQGCDSLQATWIRNTILHALRTSANLSVHEVPPNFVYYNPSIAALSAFLLRISSGQGVEKEAEREALLARMQSLVEKYSANFPKPRWSSHPESEEETVLITGTTGRLGAHLLAQLLEKPQVVHVYALNRGNSGAEAELAVRQKESFAIWGLDSDLLLKKVSFHVADLEKPNFGLDEDTFVKMRGSVTAILHNAWRVDFSVSLPSFEPLIAGTRNLLDFALSSPTPRGPKVLFVSSISALHNYSSAKPVSETLDFGPELAVGMGYGASKWVTEQVLGRAGSETGLWTAVVRVGQLSGDSRIGGWNVKEWVPAIVRASKRLGCVPAREDTVSWVPIDAAASALLEILRSEERICHLTSPRPAAWNDVFRPIAERLRVPLVSPSEWLKKLRESARRAEAAGPNVGGHDSAHTLIDFFEATMARREVLFGTERSVTASPTLAGLGPLGQEDALKWLTFWENLGFLHI